jgi:hypothetical protein
MFVRIRTNIRMLQHGRNGKGLFVTLRHICTRNHQINDTWCTLGYQVTATFSATSDALDFW